MQYHGESYDADVWNTYWFERNLQGDVVAVYNQAGTKLIEYWYDAWGNTAYTYYAGASSTAAVNNPFRYRGYYYDNDLGLYYLQTRYYDANTGRFINTDSALYHSMLGYNMFAYCNNNPINYIDYSGESTEAISGFWNALGNISGKTPTWIDDLVWLAGALVLGGLAIEGIDEDNYYNPMWDLNYQQKFIADTTAPPQSITPGSDSSSVEIRAKEEVDPYRRAGQKKQGGELKNESRRNEKFKDRSNKRHGRSKPKKHTPAKDHRKDITLDQTIRIF